jgi:hypothetical protein
MGYSSKLITGYSSKLSRPPRVWSEKLVLQIPLESIISIDLRKPYAKTKVGESCTCMMFIDSCCNGD